MKSYKLNGIRSKTFVGFLKCFEFSKHLLLALVGISKTVLIWVSISHINKLFLIVIIIIRTCKIFFRCLEVINQKLDFLLAYWRVIFNCLKNIFDFGESCFFIRIFDSFFNNLYSLQAIIRLDYLWIRWWNHVNWWWNDL